MVQITMNSAQINTLTKLANQCLSTYSSLAPNNDKSSDPFQLALYHYFRTSRFKVLGGNKLHRKKAVNILKPISDKNPDAAFMLGCTYIVGEGVSDINYRKSMTYLSKISSSFDKEIFHYINGCVAFQLNEMSAAFKCFDRKVTADMDVSVLYALSRSAELTVKEKDTLFNVCRSEKYRHDQMGQDAFNIASTYDQHKQFDDAMRMYAQSAELGYDEANVRMGKIHLEIHNDIDRAEQCLWKHTNNDSKELLYKIATIKQTDIDMYVKLSGLGHREANYDLFLHEYYTNKCLSKAIAYCQQCPMNEEISWRMGYFAQIGKIPGNACDYYNKYPDYPHNKLQLAACYQYGLGVKVDKEKAFMHYSSLETDGDHDVIAFDVDEIREFSIGSIKHYLEPYTIFGLSYSFVDQPMKYNQIRAIKLQNDQLSSAHIYELGKQCSNTERKMELYQIAYEFGNNTPKIDLFNYYHQNTKYSQALELYRNENKKGDFNLSKLLDIGTYYYDNRKYEESEYLLSDVDDKHFIYLLGMTYKNMATA